MENSALSSDLAILRQKADGYVAGKTAPLPRIGISANRKEGISCIADPYCQAVLLAGGAPAILPVMTDVGALAAVADTLDGLILSGGGDMDPSFWAEAPVPELDGVDAFRDAFDFLLLRLAFIRQIPILGICRGHQVINVAFGGTIYQDIHTQFSAAALPHSQTEPRHCATHTVTLADMPSALRAIVPGKNEWAVNSLHHQAVKAVAPGLIATATAPDGINEGIELPEYPLFGVQWHPEQMAVNGDEDMLHLFRFHVRRAAAFAKARRLHSRILTVDAHTDAPMVYAGDFDLGLRTGGVFNPPYTESKVNLPLMELGRLDAVCMAAYVPQGERTEVACLQAWAYALDRLAQILRQAQLHPSRAGIARTPDDLIRLKREGKKAILPALENGYAIGKDLGRLKTLKRWGVCYITLCHNGANDICDSATGQPEWGGLSPFGRKAVHEMNRLGILIDVSHAAETTFYDVLNESRAPVIASHSSVRALCNHPRNLTDDQIRALAAKGGVVHICLYTGFIRENSGETGCPEATLSDAVRHIGHAVRLAGVDHVGIGSDFDGGGELIGCRAANELIQITVRLLEEGYSDEDIRKIMGGNLLRVMQTVQDVRI
ncbi:MAG: gamma-glutamyl-gamma-aminobutyrate hydrolase family protein [Tannerella sp.]|jgi:microsomal dipeptidase-like Zn-dependent dipeptidase/gamma-glutamyl-gamma-aminobutyrate hydrolase PuuD|nr:gamma-glutamyl-gamma-aminobutyrate hydrolase family protein [Tannerella sp.]